MTLLISLLGTRAAGSLLPLPAPCILVRASGHRGDIALGHVPEITLGSCCCPGAVLAAVCRLPIALGVGYWLQPYGWSTASCSAGACWLGTWAGCGANAWWSCPYLRGKQWGGCCCAGEDSSYSSSWPYVSGSGVCSFEDHSVTACSSKEGSGNWPYRFCALITLPCRQNQDMRWRWGRASPRYGQSTCARTDDLSSEVGVYSCAFL